MYGKYVEITKIFQIFEIIYIRIILIQNIILYIYLKIIHSFKDTIYSQH